MDRSALIRIVDELFASNKGILASDSSPSSMKRRLEAMKIVDTPENRYEFRRLMYTTEGLNKYISGIIMHDEIFRSEIENGKKSPEYLTAKSIIPGIKVDKGTLDLPNFPKEKITAGLDDLQTRLEEYANLGAKFAKWRSVISISENTPNKPAIDANMLGLAIYASYCQQAGLVPIVEPEVIMDGDHDEQRCAKVTKKTLDSLWAIFFDHKIDLSCIILKINMILPGKDNPKKLTPSQVADITLKTLKDSVSVAVPGVVFLSGGQSEDEAARNLDAIVRQGEVPWRLSFSYERALQESSMSTWGGKRENIKKAQKVFLGRLETIHSANKGKLPNN